MQLALGAIVLLVSFAFGGKTLAIGAGVVVVGAVYWWVIWKQS